MNGFSLSSHFDEQTQAGTGPWAQLCDSNREKESSLQESARVLTMITPILGPFRRSFVSSRNSNYDEIIIGVFEFDGVNLAEKFKRNSYRVSVPPPRRVVR